MSRADPWVEYRLRRIEFQNGAEVGFRHARMLYNEDDHIIAIEHIDAPSWKIDEILAEIADAEGNLPELKTIFYDMAVEGHAPIRFFHPMRPFNEVRILDREPGRSRLFFAQGDGRAMFTKEWTLRDVSEGKIDSDKPVWQFHGYRHER